MKIFFPIGSYYPAQSGGPNNTIYWMAKALNENNCEVTVLATSHGLAKNQVEFNKWVQTESGKVRYQKDWLHYMPFTFLILGIIQTLKTDIIHLTAVFYPPSWILATVAVLARKKVVWSPRGEMDKDALIYSTWKKKPILWYVRTFLAARVTFHITSHVEYEYTKTQFGANIKHILLPNYMALPQKLNSPKQKQLLYIGRIHPKKAIDNLIDAVILSAKFDSEQYSLKIAGECNNAYALSLIKKVKDLDFSDRIIFLGMVEKSEKQKLISESYFSILPSHTENFGNVVIEGLAQGTPVIASTGTPWEILETENAGYWVQNSTEVLSNTIDKALSLSESAYNEMCENAYRLVVNKYDISKNVQHWINAYQNG